MLPINKIAISREERLNRINKILEDKGSLTIDTSATIKTYAYVRVSTEQQHKEGVSLEAQEREIRQYCIDNKLPPPKILTDAGISGKDMENRPDFQEMIKMVNRGDYIIAHSISRLGRNTKQILIFLDNMKDAGVKVISLKENIDLSSGQGQFVTSIMASVAQLELTQTRERIVSAMSVLQREGKLHTKPRYGYKYTGKKGDKNRELVEDIEEQRVINYIFQLILNDPKIPVSHIVSKVNIEIDARKLYLHEGKEGAHIYHALVTSIIKNNNLRQV